MLEKTYYWCQHEKLSNLRKTQFNLTENFK
jgi:hypothetical protein